MKRGCCIRSPLATKLLHVVLFHEDNTQRELTKNPAIGIHVTEAYTEFQQCPFITFEDMNILLSAIFIFCVLILFFVAETSEQRRYLVIMIIILNYFEKTVLKNIHRVLRYWQKCIWVVQGFLWQATKSDYEK